MVIFYEKPGCKTNTRQKGLLAEAGFEVEAQDMRKQDWKALGLADFFAGIEVKEWFNKANPDVKSGAIDVTSISPEDALGMMYDNPMLIRRPLIKTDQGVGCGFEPETLKRLGLERVDAVAGKEGCSHPHKGPCGEG